MISFDQSAAVKVGATAPALQPEATVEDRPGCLRYILTWSGDVASMLTRKNTVKTGATSLPTNAGATFAGSDKVICDDAVLTRGEGDLATLRSVWRTRNERETDSDVAAGLQSRTVSGHLVERQEFLENYASAVKKDSDDKLNRQLLQLWIDEEDPAVKAAFKVSVDGETFSLDDGTAGDPFAGSDMTLAVAQRLAMGIQYATRYVYQVNVRETWREPPTITLKSGVILSSGLPTEHQPLYHMPAPGGASSMDWMRLTSAVEHQEGTLHVVTYMYVGIPVSMKPQDPPKHWGDKAIDGMLYDTESGGGGAGGNGGTGNG